MSRERFSILLRWVGLLIGGGVLAVVLGARGAAGPQRRDVAAPAYVSAPGGQSPALAHVVADVAGPHISGPYTSTTPALSFDGDVRQLPQTKQPARPDRPEVDSGESELGSRPDLNDPVVQSAGISSPTGPNMPSPIKNFAGLDFASTAGFHPPDTNGDVGPNHYVQTVNADVGIYSKTTGAQLATFSFNSLFATSGTGTACDANNLGDPVALYDAQANRFIVTDFAFTNTTTGPFYECIAATKTGDPTGAWWLYALRADDDAHKFLADYPKLGVWPDGIYMSANMFDCSTTCNGNFKNVRVWALNRADLYSGAALQSVFFDVSPSSIFTLLPSNLRGPAPPAGSPNYFVANDQSVFGLDVFKFHVDFATPLSSTFTGPTLVSVASYAPPPLLPATIPEQTGNGLDSLYTRLIMQNQYRNIGGNESLWVTHAADDAPTGVRWYQLDVTGGTIATTPVQQSTYKPDSNYRWVPSLAVDKSGDMAIGYSVSSSSIHPDIRYAGRLVTDTLSTLGQGETTLVTGSGGQTGNCGGHPCTRWGDYSAMTVDPTDDCTFWYTNEYYATDGLDWQTRIGSFKFPSCGAAVTTHNTYLPMVSRTLPGIQGYVTFNGGPAAGVFLELRHFDGHSFSTVLSTNTNGNGYYDFASAPSLPAGQYYYVRYLNHIDPSRLASWGTATINYYTAGGSVGAGYFDLANVALVSPASGATVALPALFQWVRRPATPTDNYQLTLFDPHGSAFGQTDLLGYVNGVNVTGVPSGFHSGTPYGWYVAINSPDGGYGESYYYQTVTFSNVLASSQPAVAGGAELAAATPPVDLPRP